jgi:tetratricopeptide (TPR) repeat protein
MSKMLSKSFIIFALIIGFSVISFGQSTISGIVFDKQRNALNDIDVELLNDYYQSIRRTRTDSSGRYNFDGLNNGRYSVRVFAFRYDLEDQTQEVEINTQSIRGGAGVGFFPVDFYLLPKKGGLAANEAEVVFAQNVTPEAKKFYDKAMGEFSKNKPDDALMSLNEAIKIFPDYFLALQRIGKELFIKQRYEESAQFYFKAIQINAKSASCYYGLGSSLYKMGKDFYPAAMKSLTQAASLAPSSAQILWALGKVERSTGNFAEAEKHLLQVKKLLNGTPEIHKDLAQLYSEDLKKYKEAADELELYLKAGKFPKEEEDKMKKIIANLRAKANKS